MNSDEVDYLRARQAGKNWYWTVWRPQLVVGEAIGANLNVLPPLGVYAALRREAGLPLAFDQTPRLFGYDDAVRWR